MKLSRLEFGRTPARKPDFWPGSTVAQPCQARCRLAAHWVGNGGLAQRVQFRCGPFRVTVFRVCVARGSATEQHVPASRALSGYLKTVWPVFLGCVFEARPQNCTPQKSSQTAFRYPDCCATRGRTKARASYLGPMCTSSCSFGPPWPDFRDRFFAAFGTSASSTRLS